MLPTLHRCALAPALSLVLAAGGVTLTAAPATAARLVARPTTAGFRDCRGVWHPWDEVA